MKRITRKIVLIALIMLTAFSLTTSASGTISDGKSSIFDNKKGVSAANVDGAASALGDVGAGWFYTWASGTEGITPPAGVEFVPMIWGADSVNPDQLNEAKSQGSTLLSFNEPDQGGQANMSVDQALDLWPQLQDTGMRLGAPAVAGGADQQGGWLDQFMSGAADRGYRVDFIPLHWYGGDFSDAATDQLKCYLQAVYDRYHKPIWLTEYALTDFTSNPPRYPSADEQANFARNSTAMLQGLDFVERYAWFTLSTATAPTGLYDGATANASGEAYRAAG